MTRSINVDANLIERFGASAPKRLRRFSLPLSRLDPQIRLAHRRAGAHVIPERIIVDHEIVVVLAGNVSFIRSDGTDELGPGDLVLIRPFSPHSFRFSGRGVEHLAIHFDLAPNVPPRTRDARERRPYKVFLGNDSPLPVLSSARTSPWARPAAQRIVDYWTRAAVLDVMAARAELLILLISLTQSGPRDAAPDSSAHVASGAEAAVRRALEETPRLGSVRAFAKAAGLSPSHLRRIVRGLVGQSPATYLRTEQVNRARRLLADPSRSIKSVALDAGFVSPHHFSRVFRRIDGLTPSEYRAALIAGTLK